MNSVPSGATAIAAALKNLAVAAAPLTSDPPEAAPRRVTTAPELTFTLRTLLAVPDLSTTYSMPLAAMDRPAGPAKLALLPVPSV
jgi:hypothetical protein